MTAKIAHALRKLRDLNPSDPAVTRAERFLESGRSEYANHDFDILNALVLAITRYERGWR